MSPDNDKKSAIEGMSPEDELLSFMDAFGKIDILSVALRGKDNKKPPTKQEYEEVANVEVKGIATKDLVHNAISAAKRYLTDNGMLEGMFRITIQCGQKGEYIRSKHFRLP